MKRKHIFFCIYGLRGITVLFLIIFLLQPYPLIADSIVTKDNLRPLSYAEHKEPVLSLSDMDAFIHHTSGFLKMLEGAVRDMSQGEIDEPQAQQLRAFLNSVVVVKGLPKSERGRTVLARLLDIVIKNYGGLYKHKVLDDKICRRLMRAGGFHAIEASYNSYKAMLQADSDMAGQMLMLCARGVSLYETNETDEIAYIGTIANKALSRYVPQAKRAQDALDSHRDYDATAAVEIESLNRDIGRKMKSLAINNAAVEQAKGASGDWEKQARELIEKLEKEIAGLQIKIKETREGKSKLDLSSCAAVTSDSAVALRLIVSCSALSSEIRNKCYAQLINPKVSGLCTALAIANRADMEKGLSLRSEMGARLDKLLKYEAGYKEFSRVIERQMQVLSEMTDLGLYVPLDNDPLLLRVAKDLLAAYPAQGRKTSWRRGPNDTRLLFLTAAAIHGQTSLKTRELIQNTLYEKMFRRWLEEPTSWDTDGRLDISVGALTAAMRDILKSPYVQKKLKVRLAYQLIQKIYACRDKMGPDAANLDTTVGIFKELEMALEGNKFPKQVTLGSSAYDLHGGIKEALGILASKRPLRPADPRRAGSLGAEAVFATLPATQI